MWRHNVDLLAYHDLDGRSGFKREDIPLPRDQRVRA